MPEPEKELYTVAEAAERLNVKPGRVKELYLRGELPPTRIGRLVRFHRDDIAAFIAARRPARRPGPLS